MKSTPETRARAQAVLDYIHEHPKEHDQAFFFIDDSSCGTTMCIAGTTLFLAAGSVKEAMRFANKLGGYTEAAGELLGLEVGEYENSETHAVFYEMDNERAIQKLKKIVVGEPFSADDFETSA